MPQDWYVYCIDPIDVGWELQPTVVDTMAQIAKLETAYRDRPSLNAPLLLQEFTGGWIEARDAMIHAGWRGDTRQVPVVFWVPERGYRYSFGFVVMQNDDRTTFVASPVRQPHLARIDLAD